MASPSPRRSLMEVEEILFLVVWFNQIARTNSNGTLL
jgi:hypothetical protein